MNQLDTERIRAAEVAQLLENKYFKEAIDAVETSILDQMDQVSARDAEMHTRLIITRQCMNALKAYLHRVIQTGDMAKMQIAQAKKKAA